MARHLQLCRLSSPNPQDRIHRFVCLMDRHRVSLRICESPQNAYRRALLGIGVRPRQAERIASAEFSTVKLDLVQHSSAGDQRVMPHQRGWIVTRSLEEVRARFFERFADAVRHAKREARTALTSAILVYDGEGRALLRIDLPRWRSRLA